MQTSPIVGISFCLIIVRLGFMTPEVRDDSWQSSQRSRSSRAPTSDSRSSGIPVSLGRIKVDRDMYVSECESGVMDLHMKSPPSPREM